MNRPSFKNVVISGDIGTGTSTLAKGLAEKLGWKYLSAGDFFRAYHQEHHIPLWNKAAIPDRIEKKIDYEFLEKMKHGDGCVFDAHYAGWFARNLPDVFRILLICDKDIATQRIIDREQSEKEPAQQIEERRKQLREKFEKLYGNDKYEDPKYFHLVIDTASTGVQDTILAALDKITTAP
ncbi:MAG TPA: cytidylate kinase family protein [Candidatus Nanoarchaeia archaeon]